MGSSIYRYRAYHKSSERLSYINAASCHPPIVLKNMARNISKRISSLSSSHEVFDAAVLHYNNFLAASESRAHISYMVEPNSSRRKHLKKKNDLVSTCNSLKTITPIGRLFLKLISKHSTSSHRYRHIFNRDNVKVSFSYNPNIKRFLVSTPSQC